MEKINDEHYAKPYYNFSCITTTTTTITMSSNMQLCLIFVIVNTKPWPLPNVCHHSIYYLPTALLYGFFDIIGGIIVRGRSLVFTKVHCSSRSKKSKQKKGE